MRNMLQKPSIGRIVHFNNAGIPNAAIIIAVHSDTCVSLSACNSSGTWSSHTSLELGDAPGSWCWPPKV